MESVVTNAWTRARKATTVQKSAVTGTQIGPSSVLCLSHWFPTTQTPVTFTVTSNYPKKQGIRRTSCDRLMGWLSIIDHRIPMQISICYWLELN